jgi:hypothetical protein
MDAQVEQAEGELIHSAAMGDRDAQAELVGVCVSKQFVGVTPLESLVLAEAFARQAAAHGQAGDALMLAGVLRVRANHVAELGDLERALVLLKQSEAACDAVHSAQLCEGAEFLAGVLTAEADAGDELAALRLGWLTEILSPADADKLRCTLNRACRQHRERQEAAING